MAILNLIWEKIANYFKLLKWLFFEDYLEFNRRCEDCKYCIPIDESMIKGDELYKFNCAINCDAFIRYSSQETFSFPNWEESIKDWGNYLAANCEEFERHHR